MSLKLFLKADYILSGILIESFFVLLHIEVNVAAQLFI